LQPDPRHCAHASTIRPVIWVVPPAVRVVRPVVWVVRSFYVHFSSERSESRLSLDVRLLRPDARLLRPDARPDIRPLRQSLATLEKWMQQHFPTTTLRSPENDIRPVRPLRYVVRPVVEVVQFPENWQVARVASV
jgi:hypothetical protein